MHLICLGVVRKLVWLWLCSPLELRRRLSAHQVAEISDNLISMKPFIPKEFARKPRSLSEWQRWKATEFRQLLLYTGPVVFASKLPDAVYHNFLLLSVDGASKILVVASMVYKQMTLVAAFSPKFYDACNKQL